MENEAIIIDAKKELPKFLQKHLDNDINFKLPFPRYDEQGVFKHFN